MFRIDLSQLTPIGSLHNESFSEFSGVKLKWFRWNLKSSLSPFFHLTIFDEILLPQNLFIILLILLSLTSSFILHILGIVCENRKLQTSFVILMVLVLKFKMFLTPVKQIGYWRNLMSYFQLFLHSSFFALKLSSFSTLMKVNTSEMQTCSCLSELLVNLFFFLLIMLSQTSWFFILLGLNPINFHSITYKYVNVSWKINVYQ